MPESAEARSRLEWLRSTAASLGRLRAGGPPADDVQEHPMRSLLRFYESLAQWGDDDPAEAAALRARVRDGGLGDALRDERARRQLTGYLSETEDYADRGRFDGYRPACEHRSAVQLLMDDFAEADLLRDVDLDLLEEVDEELSDAAEEAPPPHRRQIPSWAPRTHWWWWAPKRTDMDMREYGERLYGGSLEEFEGSAPGAADWLRCGDERCWCATAPG